jgi:hypothetical protein
MNNKEKKLIEFALRVLDTMEHDDEWNADTIETISDHAMRLGLAFAHPETSLFTKQKSLLG